MSIGVVGRKCGMTRVFADNGASVPVTVIEVEPNRITQVKSVAVDGYHAVQVTCGARKPRRVPRPRRGLWEFRVASESELDGLEPGGVVTVERFAAGQLVDVSGTSKGKGFAGVVKRWNFSTQDATHGNSLSHRAPGSIGQNQTPGRVFKGKKMAGHMGAERVTVQNLEVVRVDAERNLLLVKGAVPGADGGNLIVRFACKAKA